MYLENLKSAIVEAMRIAVAAPYIDTDFTNTWIGIEYPQERQHYPGIWVTYDDTDTLRIASIDHKEFVTDDDDNTHEVTRWLFEGTVTMSVVALSSLERDRLYDQIVRVYAFSRTEDALSEFRNTIENNDFLAINPNWDELRPGGDAAAPGTPWGTEDEVIYEKALSFDVIGEFVSDPSTNTLAILSAIHTMGVDSDLNPLPPLFTNEPPPVGGGVAFTPNQWH